MKKVSSYFIKIFSLVVLTGVLAVGIGAGTVFATAGVSDRLSYQGRLTDQNGSPKTGTHYICYSIYDAQSGGTKLWPSGTPTATSTMVSNGVFNAPLGEMDSLASYDFSANGTEYLNVEVSATSGTCGGAPFESLSPRQPLSATPYARVTENLYGGEAQIGDPNGVTSGQKLLKLAVKSVADTVGASGCSPNGAMWYNSGNARTLVCNNNLYQVVGSPISNQYFDISGPTLTGGVKTFAFPDVSATVLTSNNAVTAPQGGTGQTTYTIGDLLYASASNALSKLIDVTAGSYLRSGGAGVAPVWSTMSLPNTAATGDLLYGSATNVFSTLAKGTANQVLSMDGTGTNVLWATASGGTNTLLDSTKHTDTTTGTVARGDIITGQTATPKWTRLAKGTANQVLSMDGTATDVVWATPAGGGDMVLASTQTNSGLKTFNDATLGLRNVANTFTSLFTNTNTAARTYTLPDVSGTVLTSGAAVTVAQGGTGQITASAAFDALDPMTTIGDIIYGGTAGTATRLGGVAGFLKSTGAAAPAWSTINLAASADVGTSILPVADGGTGLATLTLNNLMLGNGTTAPTFVAPGTAGNLLQSNGTTWTSAASGVLIGHRLITASPYTPTTGTNVIVVRIVGGGGGGAGATGIASGCSAGGGGGGSSYAEKRFAGIAGAASYTVTVGAAGSAGTATTNGGVGGNSTFVCPATCTGGAVTVTANGGLGGIYTLGIAGAKTFLGGAGGAVSTLGDVNTGGQPGGSGVCVSGTVGISGQGAPSQFGGGGTAKNTALAGTAGVGYGSGGGGGLSLSATGVAGGAGTAGVIVIDEYR